MENRLKTVRLRKGLSREALAQEINTSKGQIYNLETGKNRLSDVWLAKLAPALQVPQGALLSDGAGFEHFDTSLRQVPILDDLEARKFVFAADPQDFVASASETVYTTHEHDKLLAYRVPDSSMNRSFHQGVVVIVDFTDTTLEDKKHYLVRNGDKCLVRLYRSNPMRFEPQSLSEEHDTLFPDEDTHIIGRIIRYFGDCS